MSQNRFGKIWKCIPVLLLASLFSSAVHAQSAAYIRGNSQPWGASSNENAMDAVFGAGNWADLTMAGAGNAPFLSAAGYQFIFLEGSDATALELDAYLTAHRTQIEAFVNAGGRLLLNSAPNEGSDIDFGFGGVTLRYNDPLSPTHSDSVTAADTSHPVFTGPATPVVTDYTGNYFGHALVGDDLSAIVIGATGDPTEGQIILGEKAFGSGCVLFGGMTTDNFHSPQPEAANLRANIIDYTANDCSRSSPIVTKPTPVPVGGAGLYLLLSGMLAGMGLLANRRSRSGKAA